MQLLSLLRSCSILSFLVLLHEILEVQSLYHGNRSKVPAVIIFGDSIVDPGNNNMLPTIAKCNFPPYGRDFIQHKPTGRFSNGKIPSDMLASALGIKEYLPAYLDPQLKPKDLLTGVSFASAGAGYDPLTAELLSVLSLSDQLEMFKEYIGKLKGIVGEERAGRIVSDSFYLVVFGFNDVATTYFFTPLRRIQYDFPSYSRFLAQSASSFFQMNDLSAVASNRIMDTLADNLQLRNAVGGLEGKNSSLQDRVAELEKKEKTDKEVITPLRKDLEDTQRKLKESEEVVSELVRDRSVVEAGAITKFKESEDFGFEVAFHALDFEVRGFKECKRQFPQIMPDFPVERFTTPKTNTVATDSPIIAELNPPSANV
ncbi:GDSL esterase/lipase At3g43570-like isoform X1 [Tasmannia lanceolata]|uniref:GDSL esterase/lipase At3g43570-like isoform X1 n=1 Tax=Tasmannia lanceolata TaxID=3420 RepID=UPI0040647893